jgi:hypothetical protein
MVGTGSPAELGLYRLPVGHVSHVNASMILYDFGFVKSSKTLSNIS